MSETMQQTRARWDAGVFIQTPPEPKISGALLTMTIDEVIALFGRQHGEPRPLDTKALMSAEGHRDMMVDNLHEFLIDHPFRAFIDAILPQKYTPVTAKLDWFLDWTANFWKPNSLAPRSANRIADDAADREAILTLLIAAHGESDVKFGVDQYIARRSALEVAEFLRAELESSMRTQILATVDRMPHLASAYNLGMVCSAELSSLSELESDEAAFYAEYAESEGHMDIPDIASLASGMEIEAETGGRGRETVEDTIECGCGLTETVDPITDLGRLHGEGTTRMVVEGWTMLAARVGGSTTVQEFINANRP